jgi:hypothetical protein
MSSANGEERDPAILLDSLMDTVEVKDAPAGQNRRSAVKYTTAGYTGAALLI